MQNKKWLIKSEYFKQAFGLFNVLSSMKIKMKKYFGIKFKAQRKDKFLNYFVV